MNTNQEFLYYEGFMQQMNERVPNTLMTFCLITLKLDMFKSK